MVKITHPFHPLFGREYRLITHRKTWGEDRVYFQNEAGRFVGLPAQWTDLFPEDPFQMVAAGQAPFRPTDLLQLAELIERLQSARKHSSLEGDAHER